MGRGGGRKDEEVQSGLGDSTFVGGPTQARVPISAPGPAVFIESRRRGGENNIDHIHTIFAIPERLRG